MAAPKKPEITPVNVTLSTALGALVTNYIATGKGLDAIMVVAGALAFVEAVTRWSRNRYHQTE